MGKNVLTLVLLCSSSVALALKPEWVAKDKAVLGLVQSALPAKTAELDPLLVKLRRSLPDQDPKQNLFSRRQLGFGAEMVYVTRPGGYLSCHTTIKAHRGRMIELKVVCGTSERSGSELRKALGPLLSRFWKTEKNSWTYERVFAENRGPYAAEVARALGPQTAVEVPNTLQVAYSFLLQGTTAQIGNACGVAGTPPAGYKEMRSLIEAKRYDLIGNVLRGYNPGGRIYAALAMQKKYGNKVPADARAVIEKLKTLPMMVSQCSGCMGASLSTKQLLEGNNLF